jgi:DNA-binding NarL/FixJ family response regulator
VRLARAGWSYPQIAARLGLSRRQVALRVRAVLPPIARAETCRVFGIDAILQRVDAGESYSDIARAVGCHWSTVRYHVRQREKRQQVAS